MCRHFSIKTLITIIYRGNEFQGFGKYSTEQNMAVAVNNANITGEGACSEGQLKSDSRENHNF
jgi:hypothetical protein